MHKTIERLANFMALLGGMVLSAVIVLTCVSVLGRMLNTLLHGWFGTLFPQLSKWALDLGIGPINGDFEIVEVGIAFAIFAFLPLCQFSAGHAVVDLFTSRLSDRVNRVLICIIEGVFALVLILITVQLFAGMSSKLRYGEETFILQFPVWWGYAACLFAAIITSVIAVYMVVLRCGGVISGKGRLE